MISGELTAGGRESPPVRAICRGEQRRPSKWIRRRAEAATGDSAADVISVHGFADVIAVFVVFVVDAFWIFLISKD